MMPTRILPRIQRDSPIVPYPRRHARPLYRTSPCITVMSSPSPWISQPINAPRFRWEVLVILTSSMKPTWVILGVQSNMVSGGVVIDNGLMCNDYSIHFSPMYYVMCLAMFYLYIISLYSFLSAPSLMVCVYFIYNFYLYIISLYSFLSLP